MKLLKLLFLLILSIPASAQIQLGADIDGEAPGDGLSKVSISSDGELLAIGMPLSEGDSSYFRSGRVKVYQYNNGNWSQFGGAIDGQQSSETFGSSLALSADSNILAIGAVGYNYNQGALRVYRFNSGSWNQLGNDIIGNSSSYLGYSIATSSNGMILAVGLPCEYGLALSGNSIDTGKVRVYA